MTKIQKKWNNFFLIFGTLCILYYLGMGLAVRFGQSLLFLWPVVGVACLLRYFLWRRAFKKGKSHPFPSALLIPFRVLICLFLAFFFIVEGKILVGSFRQAPQGLDTVIVLGARVNEDGPSGALKQRSAAAVRYLSANENTFCIASGGQGADEPMSESSCIRDLLVQGGIAPERIVLEESSTDTIENLIFSRELIKKENGTIGIITNDFHICRALYIASQLGWENVYGVPARSTTFGYVHYAAREFCGFVVSWITGELPLKPFFGL